MNRQARPIANPFVLLREEFDDWAILFDPDRGFGFGLSPTGVYVWKMLDGSRSIDDLCNMIRELVENVPADVGDHVSSFVDALAAEGLVSFDLERPVNQETADGAETRLLAPSGCDRDDCGPATIMYEPPQLVYLNQQRAAHGVCGSGSHDTQGCNANGLAPGIANCNSTGSGVAGTCFAGTGANIGQHCTAGYSCYDCNTGPMASCQSGIGCV